MKKLFLSVAILAVAASCSKNEVTDVAPSSLSSEIGFSTLNNRVTKAATSNNDDYQVFAVSTDTSLEDFYINEELDGSTDVINSGLKYYWPVDYTLDFYAYAPSTIATSAASVSDAAEGTITIDYTVPVDVLDGTTLTSSGAQEDFTVATPIVDGKQSNTVDLKFNHILSKVTVLVALSEALTDAGYELSAYAATLDVAASTGTVDVMADTPAITAASTAVPATYSGTTSYMILPQTAAGTTITITDLTLVSASTGNVAGGVEGKTLAPYTITATDMSTGFAANTHYTIIITIDGTSDSDEYLDIISPIEFTSDINASWTESDASITAFAGPVVETTNVDVLSAASYDEETATVTVDVNSGYEIYTDEACSTSADATTYALEIAAINASLSSTNGITGTSTSVDISTLTAAASADNLVTVTISQEYTVGTYNVGGSVFYVKTYDGTYTAE